MNASKKRNPIEFLTLTAALELLRDRGYTVEHPSLTPGTGPTLRGAGRVHRPDGTFCDDWTARLTEISAVLVVSVRVGSDPAMDAPVRFDVSLDILETKRLHGYAIRSRPEASIRVIFDASATSPNLVFVETEDAAGRSIDPGAWTNENGRRVLTLAAH